MSAHTHSPTCGCLHADGTPIYAAAPSPNTQKAMDWCEKHIRESLKDLGTLVKIPSVSLEDPGSPNMQNSAQAVAELFHSSGLENVQVIQFGDVHPYVYADWIHKPDAPTLLLYAHHDVQPMGRLEKWKSHPFDPVESQGRIFGRGSADDKAGILAHVAAIKAFMATRGELPVNVRLLIEGEEETGSTHLAEFVKRYKHMLTADGMILTDCANVDSGIPSITTALRGLVAFDVEVESLAHPVHSGLWGGILPDPVAALSRILSTLVDPMGHILVPGLEEDVKPLTESEIESFRRLKMAEIARKATGLLPQSHFSVPEDRFAEHLWRRPSLSINAIQSGSRSLVSNVIQDGAWARISIRIVPDMTPAKVEKKLREHLEKVCPPGFKLTLTQEASSNWWRISDPNEEVYQIASRSLAKGYGKGTQFIGCGASIPFVQPLSEELGGIPAILVGVEDPYTNAHSENESLNLDDFHKTILGQIHMLADLAQWKRG